MKIGFTGTSKGMTASQLHALERQFQVYDISEAHHGDCIGADSEFHNLIRDLFPKAKIVGHPGFPESDARRANNPRDELRPVPNGGPLKRNRNIVDAVDFLFAAPLQSNEILRSGTWATVRYARRPNVGRPLVIIWPDGSIESRGEKQVKGKELEP